VAAAGTFAIQIRTPPSMFIGVRKSLCLFSISSYGMDNLRAHPAAHHHLDLARRIGDLALRCVPKEITLSDLSWSTPSARVTA
jgi:hypothetical protein